MKLKELFEDISYPFSGDMADILVQKWNERDFDLVDNIMIFSLDLKEFDKREIRNFIQKEKKNLIKDLRTNLDNSKFKNKFFFPKILDLIVKGNKLDVETDANSGII